MCESLPIRVLIVESERVVALSLTQQLCALGHDVVGQASSDGDAIAKARELCPDLVLMDVCLDGEMDGVDAADKIRRLFQLPVIYLTESSNADFLIRAKVTEPLGYVFKPYRKWELQVVIETAIYRHRAEQQRVALRDVEVHRRSHQLALSATRRGDRDEYEPTLSPRESQVMRLIVLGKSQKQIAKNLGITIQTAAKHREKVLAKLGVANDVELVRLLLVT